MQTISLNPKVEKLNNYFHYFSSKEKHEENSIYSIKKTGNPLSTYNEYSKRWKDRIQKHANKLETDTDIEAFKQMLSDYNIREHFDELFYVVQIFKRKLFSSLVEKGISEQQNKTQLEQYHLLKFIVQNKESYFDTGIRFFNLNVKHKDVEIRTPEIVAQFFQLAEEIILQNISNNIFENFDEKINLKIDDYTLDFIESLIRLHTLKKKPGPKPGPNRVIVIFLRQLLDYLNNETQLKAGSGINITNEQCRFLFKLLKLLGIKNEDDFTVLYVEDEIRTLLAKKSKKSIISKPGK